MFTIETVESRWTPLKIAEVRMMKGKTFSVSLTPKITVTPRYVIDSRIASLAEESEPPVGSNENQQIRYSWQYLSPFGSVATAETTHGAGHKAKDSVEGQLRIQTNRSFDLVNVSAMTADGSTTPLTTLRDRASGTCREQR